MFLGEMSAIWSLFHIMQGYPLRMAYPASRVLVLGRPPFRDFEARATSTMHLHAMALEAVSQCL